METLPDGCLDGCRSCQAAQSVETMGTAGTPGPRPSPWATVFRLDTGRGEGDHHQTEEQNLHGAADDMCCFFLQIANANVHVLKACDSFYILLSIIHITNYDFKLALNLICIAPSLSLTLSFAVLSVLICMHICYLNLII